MGRHADNNSLKGFAIFLSLMLGLPLIVFLASEGGYDDEATSSYTDTTSDSAVSPSTTSYTQPTDTSMLYYDDGPDYDYDDEEYEDEEYPDKLYDKAYNDAEYLYEMYGDTEELYDEMVNLGYPDKVIESAIDDVLRDAYLR